MPRALIATDISNVYAGQRIRGQRPLKGVDVTSGAERCAVVKGGLSRMQSGYSSRVTGRKSGEGFRVGNYVSTSFATQDECARFSAGNDLSRTDHNLLTRSSCII